MTINPILQKLRDMGIDGDRLTKALGGHDNWGGMVNAFEYLTVCSVVEEEFRREAANIAREGDSAREEGGGGKGGDDSS